jgi:hypothetical protein
MRSAGIWTWWFKQNEPILFYGQELGRVEDWRHFSVGSTYLLLPVSFGSASLVGP